jgi:hypothetical protein
MPAHSTHGDALPAPQPQPQPRPLRAVQEEVWAGAGAPAHARVAADATLNSQPDPQPPAATHGDSQSSAMALRDTPQTPVVGSQASAWTRLRDWAQPPNVRSWMPPTWEQIRWRGSVGEHVSREGWPRTGAQVWARVHQGVRAVAAVMDWVFGSFSRFAVASVLYALLAHLSWLSWLPWPGFLP